MKLLISIIAIMLLAAAITFSPRTFAQRGRRATETQTPTPPPPPPPAPAQTPQEVGDDDVITVNTNLVTLTATVTDNRSRYRADLKQNDFVVYEDGVRQELAYFNTGDRVPVSLGIVFDTSGSMVDKIEGVQDAVEHFVKSVSPGDEIFLVRFSDEAELVQDFTDDRRRILRAVENL
ncbi:MAG: VWA domain-containing protein, partial [Pyrinomonadaceae bacterium]|nr:VWA domain-containing protein [Pyrinomonadaceae bacterium]